MERVVNGFEIAGVAILVIGSVLAFVRAAVILRRSASAAYQRLRQDVGRAILLGLEILIIADIVQTVTVEQTIQSAVTLGLIVLVRMFLSFALAIELEGTLPWRRASTERTSAAGSAEPLQTEEGRARRVPELSAEPPRKTGESAALRRTIGLECSLAETRSEDLGGFRPLGHIAAVPFTRHPSSCRTTSPAGGLPGVRSRSVDQ